MCSKLVRTSTKAIQKKMFKPTPPPLGMAARVYKSSRQDPQIFIDSLGFGVEGQGWILKILKSIQTVDSIHWEDQLYIHYIYGEISMGHVCGPQVYRKPQIRALFATLVCADGHVLVSQN